MEGTLAPHCWKALKNWGFFDHACAFTGQIQLHDGFGRKLAEEKGQNYMIRLSPMAPEWTQRQTFGMLCKMQG
ncbi:hypothetical protein [uncultured Roseobacter sp.]|uniref:hypothetical protein n=1 Tax=uncultured Roseobacter sp. TaxID=114847 RepID=UPI00261C82AE|nr:hypothetical protein [uncultured Roseobacter sp.]